MGEVSLLELLEIEGAGELLEGHGEEGHGVDELDPVAGEADDLAAIADHFRGNSLLLQMVQDELPIKALGVVGHHQRTGVVWVEEPGTEVFEGCGTFEDLLVVIVTARAVSELRVATVEADFLRHAEVHLNNFKKILERCKRNFFLKHYSVK